ncbi:uncharacterized protein HHUB_3114 [Halobacterium hubeiense]|uniref:Uncharacterized protein n=1 Tax=Halobacterium hubeiense TaxID=1407499 RepID=A0A0U5H5A8_9EURY|nr:hypothetical protein [Halobacterium hubeiense]CQH60021.1 uncharacterized protein HHUB_3114 [Halobacterium hubeiense]
MYGEVLYSTFIFALYTLLRTSIAVPETIPIVFWLINAYSTPAIYILTPAITQIAYDLAEVFKLAVGGAFAHRLYDILWESGQG